MIIYNAKMGNTLGGVEVQNGVITRVLTGCQSGDLNAGGNLLLPGLIDVHTHGCAGMDTMDADFAPMCRFWAAHGTTSFLPTTMTMDYGSLKRVTKAETHFAGANILGFHFEGPYISKNHKGAQNEVFIKNPDYRAFCEFERVKMVTVAPELPGGEAFIKAASKNTVVSIGHTDCSYQTACSAIAAGANCLTHIYNAMPPFNHREPGPIGAAFEHKIYAQIICDGLHISKPVFLAAYKMFGPNRLILISDSIRCAGLKTGEYNCGGLKVYLKNGAARLADGTLAGSCATLLDCVKTAVRFGVPLKNAVKMASETPARLLGVRKGQIKPGYDADLLIADEELNLKTIIIGGKILNPEAK